MIGYWVSFAVIAVIIIFGIPAFKNWLLSKTKMVITPEMDKNANVKVVIYILFYLLCDLYYMSWFIDSLVCQYIFGGLIMIILFMTLSNSASYPKKRSAFERFGMIQDFVIGIFISIHLIYIIPDKELQNIVIPIVSAVYGGFITLVGVALTIRKSDKDRKEDEIKKAKPLVFIVNPAYIDNKKDNLLTRELYSKYNKGTLQLKVEDSKKYSLSFIPISNSDYSHCVIIGFRINEDYHIYDIGQVLQKERLMLLNSNYKFEYKEEITYVALLIKDMMDNIYELETNFKIHERESDNKIEILSGIETKPTTLNINSKEI